jgi:hypothetical protein
VIGEMKKRINRGRPKFDTGPILLTQCYDSYENKDEIAVLNQDMFYGINWASREGQRIRQGWCLIKFFLLKKKRQRFSRTHIPSPPGHTPGRIK